MKTKIKTAIKVVLPVVEIIYLPLLVISGLVMLLYRRTGSSNLKLSTLICKRLGIFPIRDHYYEPMFNDKHLLHKLNANRELPGINFNEERQLTLLPRLEYQTEFVKFVNDEKTKTDESAFKFGNGSFESGDAEFLFNILRYMKPKKVIEVGCGSSTKIIQKAISLNEKDQGYRAKHICIEPFEQRWLSKFPNIQLVRAKVETLDVKLFEELEDGDLLFIDSSHIIRPQGDVLHEYLTIVPKLKKGVHVHVHDIFSPKDYLETWVKDNVLFWNEQYVLEALLTMNDSLEIVAALNMLKHKYYNELSRVCSYLTPEREPGSFYFKIK